jgi:hypothetical protein
VVAGGNLWNMRGQHRWRHENGPYHLAHGQNGVTGVT